MRLKNYTYGGPFNYKDIESLADNFAEFLSYISEYPEDVEGYLSEDDIKTLMDAQDIIQDTAFYLGQG